MSTVYVTHEPKANGRGWTPDLSPAAEYGKFVYVFDSSQQPFQNTESAMTQATNRLEDFNPEEDYLLWPTTGDPAALWCCIQSLMAMGLDSITYLYWNRYKDEGGNVKHGKGFYTLVRIDCDSQP